MNSEPPFGGPFEDPDVTPVIQNEEAEQASASDDDLNNFFENASRLSDNAGQSEQSTQAPADVGDPDNSETSLNLADNSGQSGQSSNSVNIPANIKDRDDFFMELVEANNISRAAYKELMTIAVEAKSWWFVDYSALGSLEEIMQMFRIPALPGMRVDCSTHSTRVPIDARELVSIMMDADLWAQSLYHIVCRKSVVVPPLLLKELQNFDPAIKSMLLVNTKVQLPTPLVQPMVFCFWRCLREIIPTLWAIVDISRDYFPGALIPAYPNMCRKRPSGLLVRNTEFEDDCSEVIWIENVEIPKAQSKDGIYSELIRSNLGFSAKRWVDALRWKLMRNESSFTMMRMQHGVIETARNNLLNITNNMRRMYLDIISEAPDERIWVTLSNKDVRILRKANDQANSGFKDYIAVTSFRLQAKPISIIGFLAKKNIDIQWPRLLYRREPEEVIRLTSEPEDNCIALYKNILFQGSESTQVEYLLQETSEDGFCFFATSTPFSEPLVDMVLFHSSGSVSAQPSGFALVPDGLDGFRSDASLVTVAVQQQLAQQLENNIVVEIMCAYVHAVIKELSEEGNFLPNAYLEKLIQEPQDDLPFHWHPLVN